MLDQLRQRLQALQGTAGIKRGSGLCPLGLAAIDAAIGGGFARGALHEIAAPGEAHLPAATGFVLGVASLSSKNIAVPRRREAASPFGLRRATRNDEEGTEGGKSVLWIAEDMALIESGAPYGPGLDQFGLAPEHLLTVGVAHRRDLLWAMEEALRCRAIAAVIGEVRHGELNTVAVRRLSLAAAESGALGLLLRAKPAGEASTAVTRWIVGAAPSSGGGGSPSEPRRGEVTLREKFTSTRSASRTDLPPPGGGEREPCFAAHLTRNRRGPTGSWTLQWSDSDERFILAAHAQPVAAPPLDRPYRQVA
jgi:protein ImuA